MTKGILVSMAMAALAGCAASATLYPANDAAVTTGVLHGQYLSQGTGSGWLKIPLPTGELLQGEYSVQSGPTSVSFGSILARAAAPRANAKVSGLSISATSPGARSGIAALFGDHGTTMHCEFYVNPLGNGAGGCETGAGALYQLFF